MKNCHPEKFSVEEQSTIDVSTYRATFNTCYIIRNKASRRRVAVGKVIKFVQDKNLVD